MGVYEEDVGTQVVIGTAVGVLKRKMEMIQSLNEIQVDRKVGRQ